MSKQLSLVAITLTISVGSMLGSGVMADMSRHVDATNTTNNRQLLVNRGSGRLNIAQSRLVAYRGSGRINTDLSGSRVAYRGSGRIDTEAPLSHVSA
jgi:hypothetical protein